MGNNPVNFTDPTGEIAIALPCLANPACVGAILTGGTILYYTFKNLPPPPKPPDDDCKKPCPPCNPPVGTIGYRIDPVPPSSPHYPFPGTHVHLYKMNQNPNNCQCFWQPIGVTETPPPGAVPL